MLQKKLNPLFDNEVWKSVSENPKYSVSNLGRVIGPRGFVLKPTPDKDGYLTVCLSNGRGTIRRRVHRLVGLAFIPNPKNYPEINHKDEVKTNNAVDNLEWCTNLYNTSYSKAITFKLISPKGDIVEGSNMLQFCLKHGLNVGSLHRVYLGKQRHHHGWRRYEEIQPHF